MILIAGFEGKNNSSNLVLNKLKNKNIKNIEFLYLKNNKQKSVEQITEKLKAGFYKKIILLGQKPKIKGKISVETQAKQDNKILFTNFNLENFKSYLIKNKINFYLSKNCGNSYCNNIYFFALDYILKNNILSQVVFIHLPYLANKGLLQF